MGMAPMRHAARSRENIIPIPRLNLVRVFTV